jgi:hypothetical protein
MRCFPVLLPATLLPGQWTADNQLNAADNKADLVTEDNLLALRFSGP